MSKIRVLVVDDAVVVRRMLTEVLDADPDIEVVGIAANGRIALQKIPQVTPDIVTLDIEMPELNGLETVTEIRKLWPRLPVIMFSTLTERGAAATLEALSRGASDYVAKPANVGSVTIAQQRIRDDVIPKIKALTAAVTGIRPAGLVPSPLDKPRVMRPVIPIKTSTRPIELLAIGASTGGPNALAAVLEHLPADFPVPIVITQHMPPVFTRFLAERLTARCKLKFYEGKQGAILTPGVGWIAPGDWHMLVAREGANVCLRLHQEPPENSCRPAVDPMFRSVAEVYGASTLAVILTGMGKDGLRGCEHVRAVNGQIFAQDEASSIVWGMPGFVANAGLADSVLPLDQVATEIVRKVSQSRRSATNVTDTAREA